MAGLVPPDAPGTLESSIDRDGTTHEVAMDSARRLNGSEGGTRAVLSMHVRDRTGRLVEGPLQPGQASDTPIEDAAAAAWLASQCALH